MGRFQTKLETKLKMVAEIEMLAALIKDFRHILTEHCRLVVLYCLKSQARYLLIHYRAERFRQSLI